MADESELELRIIELENKIKELSAEPEPTDITAAEVAAYNKVARILPPVYRCGRNCGRGSCGGGPCVVNPCGGGPCVVMADAGDDLAGAYYPCGRGCGRGCGRSCGCILAADAGDEGLASAARPCRGCSYCYAARGCRSACYAMAACECGGCMPGAAQPGPRGRGGVGRFANLGE